jgi:hypothetical protein
MKHPEPGARAGSREKGASWSSPPFFPGLRLPQIWMKESEERRVEFAIVASGLRAGWVTVPLLLQNNGLGGSRKFTLLFLRLGTRLSPRLTGHGAARAVKRPDLSGLTSSCLDSGSKNPVQDSGPPHQRKLHFCVHIYTHRCTSFLILLLLRAPLSTSTKGTSKPPDVDEEGEDAESPPGLRKERKDLVIVKGMGCPLGEYPPLRLKQSLGEKEDQSGRSTPTGRRSSETAIQLPGFFLN